MGANLCTLRGSRDEQLAADEHSNGRQLGPRRSFSDRIKPDCLKVEKREHVQQEEMKVAKVVNNITLEERLLASPAVRRDGNGINSSELHVSKQSNNRVCPWTSSSTPYVEIRSHFSQARDSFTVEKSKKVEETTKEGTRITCSRSQSGKLKKKVSFRLPEEADIIFFNSPEDGVGD